MRITETSKYLNAMNDQLRASERADNASRVASSGVRVASPSDDPVAYAQRIALDARLEGANSRKRAMSFVQDDLNLSDAALGSASDLFIRAREVAVQMANGAVDGPSRQAAATEINAIKSSLVSLANARGGSGYLFGGTMNQTPPFDTAGTFTGNAASNQVAIGPGVNVAANGSGANAFTVAGGVNPFATLDALTAALTANDPAAVHNTLQQLDDAHRQIVNERSQVGVSLEAIRGGQDVQAVTITTLTTARAAATEADAVSAYTDLIRSQSAYEQAVTVTKKILDLTTLAK